MSTNTTVSSKSQATRFVGSRFNSTASSEDGTLVVWNSLTGRLNSFSHPGSAKVKRLLDRSCVVEDDSAIAKYLVQRKLLVDATLDEYAAFRSQADEQHGRKDALELILMASEECNFRCTYCYETFPRGVMEPAVRLGVKRLVSRRAPTIRTLSIAWFGGEPLHGFEAIADIAPHAKSVADQYALQFGSSITTNASLLTGQTASNLLDWGVSQFMVTLDGPAEVHDKQRPLANGGGTFHGVVDNLLTLQRIDRLYSVTIRVNFSPDTVGKLEGFLDDMADAFGSDRRFRFDYRPVGKWGGPNDQDLDVYAARSGQLERLTLLKATDAKGIGVANTLLDPCGLGTNVCYAARPYNFLIGANGAVMKCSIALDRDKRNVVGHLTEAGDLVVSAEKLAPWIDPSYRHDSTCRDCTLLGSCQGLSCPLIRIERGYRPCVSTPKPALAEQMIAAHEIIQRHERQRTEQQTRGRGV